MYDFPQITAQTKVEITQTPNFIWQTVIDIWHDFLSNLPLLIGGIIIIIFTIVIVRLFEKSATTFLDKFQLKESQKTLVVRLSVIILWIFGILIAFMVILPGLTPSKALAGLGIGSIAIGFAFKDIFENFFAGILILWKFPFENGDYISCQEIEGCVVDVTIRNTLIRRPTGELVVVPNATIFKNSVDVLTDQGIRQIRIIAGVAYGEDVDQSRKIIEDAVKSCKTVSTLRPIEIFAKEFGESSINFEVAWWSDPTPLGERQSTDEVIAAIKRALDTAGIEIPFPYRTLTFKHPLTIEKQNNNNKENEIT